MSNFVVQVHKHANSNQAPAIHLPTNLPQHELVNPTLIDTAQSLFAADGVLVIHDLFSKSLIAGLHQAFADRYHPYFADREYEHVLDVGDKRKMLTLDFQAPFNDPALYANPFLLGLMQKVLGEDVVLGSFGAVIALPGAKAQHIHRDHPALFEHEAPDLQLPSFAVAVVVPLVDLTPATGSTRVWKGSHKPSRSPHPGMDEAFEPYVAAGSCYLMDYQLLHGGTANVSAQVRPILYIVYYRSWFQETVNYEKQAKIAITRQAYEAIPEPYTFLFVRQR